MKCTAFYVSLYVCLNYVTSTDALNQTKDFIFAFAHIFSMCNSQDKLFDIVIPGSVMFVTHTNSLTDGLSLADNCKRN